MQTSESKKEQHKKHNDPNNDEEDEDVSWAVQQWKACTDDGAAPEGFNRKASINRVSSHVEKEVSSKASAIAVGPSVSEGKRKEDPHANTKVKEKLNESTRETDAAAKPAANGVVGANGTKPSSKSKKSTPAEAEKPSAPPSGIKTEKNEKTTSSSSAGDKASATSEWSLAAPSRDVYIKEYAVVKRHHRMSWLRQDRILVVTATHIHNCKPPAQPGELPIPTKSFPLTAIEAIGLKMKKAFCIYVKSDHYYFYYAANALDIAYELQRRVAAANALQYLVRPKDPRKTRLLYEIFTGKMKMPRFASCGAGAFEDTPLLSLDLKVDVARSLTKQTIDGSTQLKAMLLKYGSMKATHINFSELRSDIDDVKQRMLLHVMEGVTPEKQKSGVPTEQNVERASRCIEDILQRVLFKQLYTKLWDRLTTDDGMKAREKFFQNRCKIVRAKETPMSLGVSSEFANIDYSLVHHQLALLDQLRTPNQILDQLVNVSSCVVLTIHIAEVLRNFKLPRQPSVSPAATTPPPSPSTRESPVNSRKGTMFVEDESPMMGLEGAARDVTGPWYAAQKHAKQLHQANPENEGNGDAKEKEKEKETYKTAFSITKRTSANQKEEKVSSKLGKKRTTLDENNMPVIFPENSHANHDSAAEKKDAKTGAKKCAAEDLKQTAKSESKKFSGSLNTVVSSTSQSQSSASQWLKGSKKGAAESDAVRKGAAVTVPVSDADSVADDNWDDGEVSDIIGLSMTPDMYASMSADSSSDLLSADDVLPLYIYLIAHTDLPHACAMCEWISLLGDRDEASERSYYFAMFASAIEYIASDERYKTYDPPASNALDKHSISLSDTIISSPDLPQRQKAEPIGFTKLSATASSVPVVATAPIHRRLTLTTNGEGSSSESPTSAPALGNMSLVVRKRGDSGEGNRSRQSSKRYVDSAKKQPIVVRPRVQRPRVQPEEKNNELILSSSSSSSYSDSPPSTPPPPPMMNSRSTRNPKAVKLTPSKGGSVPVAVMEPHSHNTTITDER